MTQVTRRELLMGGATIFAAAAVPGRAISGGGSTNGSMSQNSTKGEYSMAAITTRDGATIYYKDRGKGQPIVFSHGWPLSADDWDAQMLFFGQRGYRVIAHDRRGHGRSTQTWDGNDMDTYADDLAQLAEKLDLRDAIHVAHSTGGGEVARYIGRPSANRTGRPFELLGLKVVSPDRAGISWVRPKPCTGS